MLTILLVIAALIVGAAVGWCAGFVTGRAVAYSDFADAMDDASLVDYLRKHRG